MPIPYKTIETISLFDEPGYSYTMPGEGTCGGWFQLYAARSRTVASSSTGWYTPKSVSEYKPPHPRSARSGAHFPRYNMSNYSVCQIVDEEFLTKRLNANTSGLDYYKQTGKVSKVAGSCKAQEVSRTCHHGASTYYEVKGPDQFSGFSTYQLNSFNEDDLVNARRACADDASVNALTSYDALTELAEMREVPKLVRSNLDDISHILKTFIGRHNINDVRRCITYRPKDALRDASRAIRKIGSEWMQYRYGIMPLVYSSRDIVKTVNRGAEVTCKKSQIIVPQGSSTLPPASGQYYIGRYDGSIRITATVNQYFSHAMAATLSGVGFNPLVTAWELIPYSFVADWVFNVGDSIIRATTPVFGQRILACISQRSNYTYSRYIHFPNDATRVVTFSVYTPSQWIGSIPPSSPSEPINRPAENQLLTKRTVNAYYRELFDPCAAQLSPRFSMNWKRGIDSAVMALNNLRTVIRYLKGR